MTVKIDTGVAAAQTGGGNQDFTIPGFDEEVKAVIFDVGWAVVDDTPIGHIQIGRGWTDGVNENAISTTDATGLGSTDTRRWGTSDSCILINNIFMPTVNGEAVFVSFITDGVRVNWTNNPATAQLIRFTLIGGSGVTASVTIGTLPGPIGNTVDIDMGLVPDLILAMATGSGFGDSNSSTCQFQWGVARGPAGSIKQRCATYIELDSLATSRPNAIVMTDRIAANLNGIGGISRAFELTDILSTPGDAVNGIEVTQRGPSAFAQDVSFLGLNFNEEVDVEVFSTNAPAAIGLHSVSGIGFNPQFVEQALTDLDTEDVTEDAARAGTFGLGGFSETNERSATIQSEYGVGTTNTQSVADARAVNLPQDDGTARFVGTLSSLDDDGWTLNMSAAPVGGPSKWVGWAVEVFSSPPDADNLPEYGQLRSAIGDPPVFGATILRS